MKRLIALFLLLGILLCGCAYHTDLPPDLDIGAEQNSIPESPASAPALASCTGHPSDPYANVDKVSFYDNYTPACCYTDACYRTQHFLLSGLLIVPGQYAEISEYRPVGANGYLIRNTDYLYADDGNTYIVVDVYGNEVMRIYRGAAYITLEEVAAYLYAFGGSNDSLPANYTSKKVTSVSNNPWGIYLRGNHSHFSGNTSKYPYEPVLPNISGCGGNLQYFEMDIGTTGTDTGSKYPVKIYNDGSSITRGAARLVYTRSDNNHNGIYETDEVYVFYTANHYNDFREYLNYYGGWGEIFGNETGGGTLSSKTDCNPTPYVPTDYESFSELYGYFQAA